MKTAIFAAVALAAGASADWTDALSFACPSNTNNVCNSQQSTGFDWSTLGLGSFSAYGDFDFNGWSCESSFGLKKRDALTGRQFQDKCITGTASSDTSKCPSFGCGSSRDVTAFSVTEVEISVEFDCDLEFHYGMEDGSTCKQRSSCSSGGSVVKNSQCGGAKSVTVVYPSQTAGSGKGKDSCSIGVHSIGFDCSTASSTVHRTTAKETSQATTTTSAQVTTTSTSEVKTTTSTAVTSTVATSTAVASTSTLETSTSVQTTSVAQTTQQTTAFTTSTVFTTFVSTIISCAATVTNCPAHSTALTTVTVALSTTICPVTETETTASVAATSSSVLATSVETTSTSILATSPAATSSFTTLTSVLATSSAVASSSVIASSAQTTSTAAGIATSTSVAPSEVITTVVIETSTTVCPVTLTHTTGSSTHLETTVSVSTVLITHTSTICTKCEQTATSVAPLSGTTTTTTSAAITTAACPDVLPQCLNTWLFTLGCSSNTDVDCFCPDTTFISNVFDCVTAHGASSSEISAAQSYLQGICASYIPQNPAIVTAASSVLPDTTGTAAGTVAATTSYNVPVTTVQVFTTLVVPCTETTGISAGSVIPSSFTTTVLSTSLAVPQVVFQTITATGTGTASVSVSAALVAGTAPAAVAAGTTLATPARTTFHTASSTANGTATASPATFTGAASVNSVAFGTLGAAIAFAMMVL